MVESFSIRTDHDLVQMLRSVGPRLSSKKTTAVIELSRNIIEHSSKGGRILINGTKVASIQEESGDDSIEAYRAFVENPKPIGRAVSGMMMLGEEWVIRVRRARNMVLTILRDRAALVGASER